MNISDSIDSNFCSGCGMCTAICPNNHLVLKKNELNQITIKEDKNTSCRTNCRLCLSVCPFSDYVENEDKLASDLFNAHKLSYKQECGFYLNCYAGYHPEDMVRIDSASGGITSYLLNYLIKNNIIDAAITVKRTSGEHLFSYSICKTESEILSCNGSAYCVTPVGEIIKQVIADDTLNQIAVVALPCFCKAIRNACRYNLKLRKKVKYIIGLVCGQQKSLSFIEYLAAKNNINEVNNIHFRTKRFGRPNSNFGIIFNENSINTKEITFSSYAKEWAYKLFTLPACNYCDDIFAETADIVLMDAWLPEYKDSDKGENLIITRSQELDTIISEISTVHTISIDRIIESQASVIKNKRTFISEHLSLVKKKGLIPPTKRYHLLNKPNFLEKSLIHTKFNLTNKSEQWWEESGHNYGKFTKKLDKLKIRLLLGLILNKINTIINK